MANLGNSSANSIWAAVSTDGGLNFQVTTNALTYDNVTGPVVAVNGYNGTLYCAWTDFSQSEILFAGSQGTPPLSFPAQAVVWFGALIPIGGTLNGGVRAATNPMMKFNWHDNRVGIVWHTGTYQAPGQYSNAGVYYSYLPCVSDCNAYGWRNPMMLNDDASTTDQFQPALDYINGDVVIGFYDRRQDPTNNLLYLQYFAYVHSDGTQIQANFNAPTTASNPTYHTAAKGDLDFIGDYHDLWTWTYPEGTRAVDAWILIQDQTVIGDIELSKIQL